MKIFEYIENNINNNPFIKSELIGSFVSNPVSSENFQNLPEIIRDTDFNYFFKIENYIKENKYFIEISDNGCGMSEETVSKIFEPYFTTKANGTGLGMTMVYKIIKEFSGEIFVESKENDGTKFTIIFPIPQKDAKLLSKN